MEEQVLQATDESEGDETGGLQGELRNICEGELAYH